MKLTWASSNLVLFLFVIIIKLVSCCCRTDNAPMIRTLHGLIEGEFDVSYYNRTFMKFQGIPYARPPTGLLRFEPPRPALPWVGVMKANKPSMCIQLTHLPQFPRGKIDGTEDCLHLNVFVPRPNVENLGNLNLNVIVHIHGGSFSFSSGGAFHPAFIMDRDVLLVTLNYRLGIFGFFSTESIHYPGNMALRDQIMALRWIQNNIRRFGGNPKNVFLTGMSAGAGSVHYLTVSPLAKGLFHKVHALSGSALRQMQTVPFEKAKQVGRALGCDFTNKVFLGACLKRRRADQLVDAQRMFRPWLYNPIAPFSAVVDRWSLLPVLPKHPLKLLEEKRVHDVPFINSFCTSEGLYNAAELMYNGDYLVELDRNWDRLAPAVLNLNHMVPEEDIPRLISLVREKYFGDEPISNETFSNVVHMVGDRLFYADIDIGVRLHANAITSPVYSYMYDYLQDMPDYAMLLSGKPYKFGVSHGDDLIMLLPSVPFKYGMISARDERVVNYLLDMWETFARDGRFDNWTPVSTNFDAPLNFRLINEDLSGEMRSIEELGHRKWWESLHIRQTN